MWEKRISHAGLHAYRLVRGQSQFDLDTKARLQVAQWEERWQSKLRIQKDRDNRAQRSANQQASKAIALERTRDLEIQRETLASLLVSVCDLDTTLDFESLKQRSPYPIVPPIQPVLRTLPTSPIAPPNTNAVQPQMRVPQPKIPVWTFLEQRVPLLRKTKQREADEFNSRIAADARLLYDKQVESYRHLFDKQRRNEADHRAALEHFHKACTDVALENEKANAKYHSEVESWRQAKLEFKKEQDTANAQVDELKYRYLCADPSAVKSYFYEVLAKSSYPDSFPREHFVDITQAHTLIVDYEFPSMASFPATKEVKYIAARSCFQDVPNSEAWLKKTFDDVLYQICLRTIYELFRSDSLDILKSIVFNGWVRSIDRATGSEIHACVMSIEASKEEFLAITLSHVDPRTCFKKFKGVAASKLVELSPVKPLVLLNREDNRFVEGYAVASSLDERTNLAAMDWLDFENLIREVFEKEFSKGGGEVRITQASRDGGVDAVAFDPDPIRGGKLVIQAKRYTNTVGVSAVRDLYGTVHNEGANKGILVTTSDFGPDAYAFAKDKPLTLISGGELLYLLAQHGHVAKIDLAEAKRIAAENGSR